MPPWRIDVAKIFSLTVPAETKEDACALAQHRIDDQSGHDQHILKVEQVEEERNVARV